MNKLYSHIILISLLLISTCCFATEPLNLAIAKKAVIQYHDSGKYDKDIANVMSKALAYLKTRDAQKNFHSKKPAIVLDIDETSLSNYADMKQLDFGGTLEEIRQSEDKGIDAAIIPTLKLYQYAQAHHIAVIFLTGRHENERESTEQNLKNVGYSNWDKLILRDGEYKTKPAAVYKTALRKQLTADGYDIVLNIGDQNSDLVGGYADKTYKLPNPYYLIP